MVCGVGVGGLGWGWVGWVGRGVWPFQSEKCNNKF